MMKVFARYGIAWLTLLPGPIVALWNIAGLPASSPQLSPNNAIENTASFRIAAKQAWDITQSATQNPFTRQGAQVEAGFTVNREGQISAVTTDSEPVAGSAGSLEQQIEDDTLLAVHTHPPMPYGSPQPSPADKDSAKRIGKSILVISQSGLYEIDAEGNVRRIFEGTGWMKSK